MQTLKKDASFIHKAIAALAISIVCDALDYIGSPLFEIPVIGDVFNGITTSLLYSITRNKRSAAINLIKFIPIIGDFVPTFTISTLLWISRESKKEKKKVVAEYKSYKVMQRI